MKKKLVAVLLSVISLCGLSGCEALHKKFTRKPKHPQAAPSPIINLKDYTVLTTAEDRYRKHYMMFNYWNDELMDELSQPSHAPINIRRVRSSSEQALLELQTMQELVVGKPASILQKLVDERRKLDSQFKGTIPRVRYNVIRLQLDRQTREVQRNFFWRDVEEQLKPMEFGKQH